MFRKDGRAIAAQWSTDSGAWVVVEEVVRSLMQIKPSEVSSLDGPSEDVRFRLPSNC